MSFGQDAQQRGLAGHGEFVFVEDVRLAIFEDRHEPAPGNLCSSDLALQATVACRALGVRRRVP